jgi:hypothetical protein
LLSGALLTALAFSTSLIGGAGGYAYRHLCRTANFLSLCRSGTAAVGFAIRLVVKSLAFHTGENFFPLLRHWNHKRT